MNKKKFGIFAILFAIISVFTFAIGCQLVDKSHIVFADGDNEPTTITSEDGILDTVLFDRLVEFYNNNLPDGKTRVKNLSTDMFADDHFADMTLDLAGTDEQKIVVLTNLDMFDLSKFDKVDLSKNAIIYLTDVFKTLNLSSINLSDNYIQSFDCIDVNYLKLESLDLSFNLLVECDLKSIATVVKEDPNEQVTTVVNLQDNFLDVENLTLPTDDTVKVYLSHNLLSKAKLLEKLEVENLPESIHLGFQGVKRTENRYTVTDQKTIEFYGFDDVSQITLQKADVSSLTTEQVMNNIDKYVPEEYQNLQTISVGETYVFDTPGYYNIVFTTNAEDKQGLKVDLYFYIKPIAPKYDMYQNGQKIDFEGRVNQEVEIKIAEPQPNVTYVFQNKITGELTVGDTLKISNAGNNYFWVYQIIDGCLSAGRYLSVTYQKSVAFGWTYILIGIAVFGVVGWIVYISIPKIASLGLGKKGKNKKNLD